MYRENLKKWRNLDRIGTQSLLDHEMAETVEKMSYLQSQMRFDESTESTADSDLEDGELHFVLTSNLRISKSFFLSVTIPLAIENSMQKLRENHETIQQLTFQLKQMQEQMNSLDSPGEFQDIESKCCGRLSRVSSQLEMIPSSRSLLSRDKRLPLDTWNQSRIQENVFVRLIHPETFLKEFHLTTSKKSRSSPWRSEGKNKCDKWRRTTLWRNSNAYVCVKTEDYEF